MDCYKIYLKELSPRLWYEVSLTKSDGFFEVYFVDDDGLKQLKAFLNKNSVARIDFERLPKPLLKQIK